MSRIIKKLFWNEEDNLPTVKAFMMIPLAILMLIVMLSGFFTIHAGQRSIVFTFGKITNVRTEGLWFKIPFAQTVEKVSIRTQRNDAMATAVSKNMQPVTTTVTLNYYLDPTRLKTIYETIGPNFEAKIIVGRVQETVKAVTAKYTAEELVTRRHIVKDEIANNLIEQLAEYNIIVSNGGILITDFQFSKAFNEAIEAKQIAEQMALKAENDLKRIEVEAAQKITEAKGNAEAIRIQSLAIQSQGGKEYVQLKAIEKWDGILPTYNGGGAVPFIDISKKKE